MMSPVTAHAVRAALLLTLLVLLAHSLLYLFLTDDAFISFRYAHNLAQGHGLVFNPGQERVEGYTNFLWMVLLSAFDRAGLAPEKAAHGLSLLATALLWAVVAAFAWRARKAGGPAWIVVFAPLALALTRSVAVWSTGGLETRLFELLVVGGTLRLLVELDAETEGRDLLRPLSPLLFGLAALTRPEGLLLMFCALGAAAVALRARGRLHIPFFLLRAAPGLAVVASHVAFRFAYYGSCLPNTYYAKVGGGSWWGLGGRYLLQFALEYAAWAWIPLLVAAVAWHRARGTSRVPLVVAALILPHVLYAAAVGGDHFEYRLIDFYFPLVFLLLADGLRRIAALPAGRALAGACALLILVGTVDLPLQSHLQYPGSYLPGYPGRWSEKPEAAGFLDADRDYLHRLPGLRQLAALHRSLMDDLTRHQVGIRAEEHRLFLDTVKPEGLRLAGLVRAGLLPRDAHVAMDCVGAIPYYSGVRTLDRLGLTDAWVARHGDVAAEMLAHRRHATLEYARKAGVDLWDAGSAHLLWRADDPVFFTELLAAERAPGSTYAARVDTAWWMLARLPMGEAAAGRRMPRLDLRPLDRALTREILADAVPLMRESLRRDPTNEKLESRLARVCLLRGDDAGALPLLRHAVERHPEDGRGWDRLATCQARLGDFAGAIRTLEAGVAATRGRGEPGTAARLERATGLLKEAGRESDSALSK
ncbi:MAG: hypothetical protein HZB25_07205 [Candidatus Eisenbacteria bacterium]|nr:hypothetical protein [Candidatus Eisenbacteria bacterium]